MISALFRLSSKPQSPERSSLSRYGSLENPVYPRESVHATYLFQPITKYCLSNSKLMVYSIPHEGALGAAMRLV